MQLIGLHKEYPGAVEPQVVLRGLDAAFARGESVAIVGPSGCGKSTLLHIAGTLDEPTSGRVVIGGRDTSKLTEQELARLRNRNIGMVFQDHHLLPQCTALENALLPSIVFRDSAADESPKDRAMRLLDRAGLAEHAHKLPGQLSGGERQRVALVRALINQPDIVLADEPTGALDRETARRMMELLAELHREEKATLIVVTHAREHARMLDRTLELRDGTLVPAPEDSR
ncbi:ABC transporter ATP-binding protein [Candidatus Sumerlaeota bacterium]|nr:ABC transporter ATP-binding protein [Candidatus Sumerlaeota bacterium]